MQIHWIYVCIFFVYILQLYSAVKLHDFHAVPCIWLGHIPGSVHYVHFLLCPSIILYCSSDIKKLFLIDIFLKLHTNIFLSNFILSDNDLLFDLYYSSYCNYLSMVMLLFNRYTKFSKIDIWEFNCAIIFLPLLTWPVNFIFYFLIISM